MVFEFYYQEIFNTYEEAIQRLRKFPSLVNCCTIDWFSVWPNDALMATANSFCQLRVQRRGKE